jgi:hypothetical protein
MYIIAQQVAERENKGRAKKISFAIHLALLLLLLIPIIRPNVNSKEFERAITIDFSENMNSSTKKSGSGLAAAKPASARPKVEVAQIQAQKPTEQAVLPVPERKEIITMPTPEFEVPEVKETNSTQFETPIEETEIKEEVPDLLPEPVEKIVEKVPDPFPTIDEVTEEAEPEVDKSWADGIADAVKGDEVSNSTGSGDGEKGDADGGGKGKGEKGEGTGTGDPGKDTGEGNQGTGNFWGDMPGDGVLSRKVIEYKDAKTLAGVQGKAVLNLCVNRPGRVVFVEYDASRSSITDPDIIRKIQDLVSEYKFEQDYSAPTQQCGKYTFKYSVEK